MQPRRSSDLCIPVALPRLSGAAGKSGTNLGCGRSCRRLGPSSCPPPPLAALVAVLGKPWPRMGLMVIGQTRRTKTCKQEVPKHPAPATALNAVLRAEYGLDGDRTDPQNQNTSAGGS
jgi:hypothetical protein